MKVRCKRCGETFPAGPTTGGEVYEPTPQGSPRARVRKRPDRRGAGADLFAEGSPEVQAVVSSAPLTGERNETSVLFSVAALAKPAPAPPAPPPAVTETSALIDLRALCGSSAEAEAPSLADEIASLSGGGAFSPLLAPIPSFAAPEAPGVEALPAARRIPLALGGAVVAILVLVAFVGARAASAPDTIASPPASSATRAELPAPPTLEPSTTSPAPPTTFSAAPIVATRTPSSTATTARARVPTSDARPAAAVSAPARPMAKCCPGEDEMTCQMRLAVGAPCGGSRSATAR